MQLTFAKDFEIDRRLQGCDPIQTDVDTEPGIHRGLPNQQSSNLHAISQLDSQHRRANKLGGCDSVWIQVGFAQPREKPGEAPLAWGSPLDNSAHRR